jgi:hypothetical protein
MRKKLLSEAQVRRFQSLASIKPLNEMGDKAYKKDEMDEAYHSRDDKKMEALYEEEEDDAPPAIEMDDEGDDEMGDEMDADVSIDEELVEKFMEAAETIQELASALEGGAGDMDMDDDMGDMDMDADAGDDLGGDDEEPMNLDEALQGISYVPSQKEIVKTVAKRVAKRLQEAKRAEARMNRALGKRR